MIFATLNLMLFLVGFPFICSLILILITNATVRTFLLKVFAFVIIVVSLVLLITTMNLHKEFYSFELPHLEYFFLIIEFAMLVWIIIRGIKYKKFGTILLVLIQAGLLIYNLLYVETSGKIENALFIDKFSLIMVAIIGIIGSLICIYAIGYMQDYHKNHKEIPNRRNVFAFYLFVFLSAMFGIVFSNNMFWLNFFWEVTTFCSFVMIGYSGTKEAVNNSFRAVYMNLIGGVVFTAGIIFMSKNYHIVNLDQLLDLTKQGESAAVIVCLCLCFAGIVKSAQFPFSSWLLGAMVAPTPVSALLHSSAMVKAGVYLVVRVAPFISGTIGGNSIALIGALTFLFSSLLAISQSNSKKVLAYSTIGNLGLIIACAGVGKPEAIIAAVLLIIFHAVAKSLLFLCVGTIEHKIDSRDIEDMDWLILRLPKIAIAMIIGMAGMFLAPFGMLISKWIVLGAFIDSHSGLGPFLILALSFGGAFNLFFWTKWLGKIIATMRNQNNIAKKIHLEESVIIWTLAILTVASCLFIPFISKYFIEPYTEFTYVSGAFATNMIILIAMVIMLLVLPLSMLFMGKKKKKVTPYLSGRNSSELAWFEGSMGRSYPISLKNYYFTNLIKENVIFKIGEISAFILLITIVIGSMI